MKKIFVGRIRQAEGKRGRHLVSQTTTLGI